MGVSVNVGPTKSALVNSDAACEEMCEMVRRLYAEHRYVEFEWHTGKQRTLTQNRALHLWLGWLAERLNDAGLDMRKLLKPEIDIPWTAVSAKEKLWHPIQEAMTGNASTADAERPDYAKVQEVLSRHLAAKHGVEAPPWPSKHGREAA
jgi:hypothetical protein